MPEREAKPKILLHICCAGCGAYVSRVLADDYEAILYFYNPNIYPAAEFAKRLEETERIAGKFKLKLISEEYGHKAWLDKIAGWGKEPERGRRCDICYQDRLAKTAQKAKELGINYFTTTLTVSPHKVAKKIIECGQEEGKKHGIAFLAMDFKKQDGFKKAAVLSRELELYRQNYCGCEFSRRD